MKSKFMAGVYVALALALPCASVAEIELSLSEENRAVSEDQTEGQCAEECPAESRCECGLVCGNIEWLARLQEDCTIGTFDQGTGVLKSPAWAAALLGDHSGLSQAQREVADYLINKHINCQNWIRVDYQIAAPYSGCCGPAKKVCGCVSNRPKEVDLCGQADGGHCYQTAISSPARY